MKKGYQRCLIAFLALAMAFSSTISVQASEAAGMEAEETELILEGSLDLENETTDTQGDAKDWAIAVQGTADIDEMEEITVYGGTLEEEYAANITEALNKAQSYLKAVTVNPTIATIGGEWSVLALARNGNLDTSVKAKYLTNVYHTLDETNGILSTNKYTEYERVAMALTAIGENPKNIYGYDILKPLADYKKVKKQGINGSIFALIALDSNNYEMPKLTQEEITEGKTQATRALYIEDILKKEISGGGWALSGNTADADITAMAIQALTPYYTLQNDVAMAVDRGVQKLSELQNSNGGFESWGTENVESTAQTVIALSGLDVSLISSDRFIKDEHSLLDALLSFQNADGSFSHVPGGGADGMATDQGNLALVAYYRAISGQTRLYDMTDVQNHGGNEDGDNPGETESQENIDKFKKKMAELPKNPVIDDKNAVYALLTELHAMKKFEEKENFRNILQSQLDDISVQEKEVKTLDDNIWSFIHPLKVTLSDRAVVEKLMKQYEALNPKNQRHVKYREELLRANTIITKLIMEIIPKEVFENVKNFGVGYTYDGNGYRVILEVHKNYEPDDMKAAITLSESEEKLSFETAHKEKFPGEILIVFDTELADGVYALCKDNDSLSKLGWLVVDNNKAECNLSEGGKYVILKEEYMQKPDVEVTVSGKDAINPESVNKRPNKGSDGKKKTKTVKKTNMIDAQMENGVVKAAFLEKILGTEKILRIKGSLDNQSAYTLLIHGSDVTAENIRDFKAGITLKSSYENDIKKLAQNPLIFCFEENGDFPAEMLVEAESALDDGQYLLMHYNESERKAEYVAKAVVEDKKVKFAISKGGSYFITKRAKTKSVNEIEADGKAEEIEKESTAETEASLETKTLESVTRTENSTGDSYAPWVVLGMAAAAVIAAGIFIGIKHYRRK